MIRKPIKPGTVLPVKQTGEPALLARVVGVPGAVLMGLGSILGTGIFVSIGIAAGVAGSSVILAVAIAAVVATFNGLSSAQLAASHPVSGGLTWSFSAFTALVYYALTNLAALRLPAESRLYPRWVPVCGLASCVGLAFWVEPAIWLAGLVLIGAGVLWYMVARRSARR